MLACSPTVPELFKALIFTESPPPATLTVAPASLVNVPLTLNVLLPVEPLTPEV
jgi:hypothetical protein